MPDVSYWMLKFLRQPSAALARRYLGIGDTTDDGGGGVPGSGDVVGPASATAGNFASFGDATGKLLADSGSTPANMPSASQKAALAGTNGAPAAGNPYVTNSDPRNTNARTPSVHATTHSNGGSDPVTVTNLAGFPGGGTTFLRDDGTFASPTGSGTVTSVALTMPSAIFDVAGSPVTTSGTLAVTLDNQNANLVFAGPSSGGAAAPTFRSLVAADVPITSRAWDVIITKSADQTVTNNSTLQNDSELVTALDANSLYEIEFILLQSGNNTTGDYQGAFAHPTITVGTSTGFFCGFIAAATLTIAAFTNGATQSPATAQGMPGTAADTPLTNMFKFNLKTEAASGNLQWQFANVAAAAGRTSTTRAGSTLKVKKLI